MKLDLEKLRKLFSQNLEKSSTNGLLEVCLDS